MGSSPSRERQHEDKRAQHRVDLTSFAGIVGDAMTHKNPSLAIVALSAEDSDTTIV